MLDMLLSWPSLGALAAAAMAVAWFVPGLRRYAILALGVIAAIATVRRSGERAGAERKQKEWDNAEQNMERHTRETAARVRDVVDRAADRGVRESPYNRDNRNK